MDGTQKSCPSFLAADRLSAAAATLTSPRQTRVGGFRCTPSGRKSRRGRLRPMFTPGSRACVYEIASGQPNWPNRDPINEPGFESVRLHKRGLLRALSKQKRNLYNNLYGFVRNNPVGRYDPLGLADTGPNSLACKAAEEQAEAALEQAIAEPSDENVALALELSLKAALLCAEPKPPPPPPPCPWWKRIPPIWRFPFMILDPCIANPYLPGCGGGPSPYA